MQPKDYLALIALIVSAVSLFFSIRSSGFTRRAKLAELRVTMLAKLSEASLANSRVHRLHIEFCEVVKANQDENALQLLDMPEIAANQLDIDAIYVRTAKTPVNAAMAVYEREFHDISHICDRIRSIEDRLRITKERYENGLSR